MTGDGSTSPGYYSIGVVEDRWNDGVVHRFWRRTMEDLLGDLFGSGFLLERYLEPLPPEDVLAAFPEEDVSNAPNFLFIRAIVDPRTGDHGSA